MTLEDVTCLGPRRIAPACARRDGVHQLPSRRLLLLSRVQVGDHHVEPLLRASRRRRWRGGDARGRARLNDAVLLSLRELLRYQSGTVALRLGTLDEREDRPKPLVLHDGPLADDGVVLEDGVGELAPLAVNLDVPVLPLVHQDAPAGQGEVLGVPRDRVGHPLEMDREVLRERALFLPGEDALEVLVATEGPVGVVGVPGRLREPAVVVIHELGQVGVADVHRGDVAEAELLHEPILERLVHPLDATLRLGRVRADDVDVELAEGAPELRHALGTVGRALGVHAEDAVLVAVERHRLPVALEVRDRRAEVVEGRLGLHEPQLHELARRVIDVDEQRAPRSARFEPLVVAAIDLDELAEALAAVPGLVGVREAVSALNPDAGRQHPGPEGLPGDPDVVQLDELLLGERRPEVGVALADDRERARLQLGREPSVARAAALARGEPARTVLRERRAEAAHLPRGEPDELAGLHLGEPAFLDASDDVQPVQWLQLRVRVCSASGGVARWPDSWDGCAAAVLMRAPALRTEQGVAMTARAVLLRLGASWDAVAPVTSAAPPSSSSG